MSNAFQPLVPGSASAGARPRGAGTALRNLQGQFKPLGLSGPHLPPATAVAPSAPSGLHAHSMPPQPSPVADPPSPKVSSAITRLIRDGDRITHIEVKCSCGEIITLACGYSPADAATGSSGA